ncbi:7043_t:CDS:2 [Ambispora leptoticha]|uniref:7043_t:CDS:1 n=1 Tax=Ambispora leptoticha TaxID=144679 RepID=A0A9N9FZL7_9GLOM|nr:7043_t:CDS:2 [Ambispora leptoticha]
MRTLSTAAQHRSIFSSSLKNYRQSNLRASCLLRSSSNSHNYAKLTFGSRIQSTNLHINFPSFPFPPINLDFLKLHFRYTAPISAVKRAKREEIYGNLVALTNQNPKSTIAKIARENAIKATQKKVLEIASDCRTQKIKYTDQAFDLAANPPHALYKAGDKKADGEKVEYSSIKRIREILPDRQFFINGEEHGDVKQGFIGDCWFLAAMAAAADVPGLIESICVARDEEVGVYGFVFYKDGEWISTIIDDQVFLNKHGELLFSKCKDKNETWVPLLEKAYAKANGDYESIDGGWPGEALEDLSGGISTSYWSHLIEDKDKFWSELRRPNTDVLFGCAHFPQRSDKALGLVGGHAYSVIRAVNLENFRLLEIRNPWGQFEWKGRWKDHGAEWKPEYLKILNYSFEDDGSFFMEYDDFLKHFQAVDECEFYRDQWRVYSHWIKWTDKAENNPKFTVELKDPENELKIVLQQPDPRYSGKNYNKIGFNLKFNLIDTKTKMAISSPQEYYWKRATNLSITLPAGIYQIIPDPTKVRNMEWNKEPTKDDFDTLFGLRIYTGNNINLGVN